MNFLFDENLPHSLAAAIDALHSHANRGGRVLSVRDRTWEGYDDRDWIRLLSENRESWIVVTRDKMRNEIEIIRQSNLTWVIMHRGWARIPYWDVAWKLVKAWPEIVDKTVIGPGETYRLQVNGRLTHEI